jgi:hypothetical protein
MSDGVEKREAKVPYWKLDRNRQAVEALRKRHHQLHPLIFHRSLERASGMGELFDVLEAAPADLPITWDDKARCWRTTQDLFRTEALVGKEEVDVSP